MLAVVTLGAMPVYGTFASAGTDEPAIETASETPAPSVEPDTPEPAAVPAPQGEPKATPTPSAEVTPSGEPEASPTPGAEPTESPEPENATYVNSVSGTLWLDMFDDIDNSIYAGDGIRQTEESPLAGYRVELYKADDTDNTVASTKTGADGKYSFANIEPGSYVAGVKITTMDGVEYLLPLFWLDGTTGDNRFVATYDAVADAYLYAYTAPITVAEDSKITGMDAGMRTVPQIQTLAGPYDAEINLADGTYTGNITGVTIDAATITFDANANGKNYRLYGTTTARRIVVNAAAGTSASPLRITLDGVSITSAYNPIGLIGTANLTLTLESGTTNSLTSSAAIYAGINVPSGATLKIEGSGGLRIRNSLSSGVTAAGIGGNGNNVTTSNQVGQACGTVEINGGTLDIATAMGAGIGGGSVMVTPSSTGVYSNLKGGAAGKITINGGNITVLSSFGAGIGPGGSYYGFSGSGISFSNCSGGTAGEITITGGTVNAISGLDRSYGECYGAAIGGCGGITEGGDGGKITITGGMVSATGRGGGSAAIGGGRSASGNGGNGGIITISGGTINATADYWGAGIGGSGTSQSSSSIGGDGGTITITGGLVTVKSSAKSPANLFGGAGIGGGGSAYLGAAGGGGSVSITGGTVIAKGGGTGGAPGIGAGVNNSGTLGTGGTNIFTSGSIYPTTNAGVVSVTAIPRNGTVYGNDILYMTTVTVEDISGASLAGVDVKIAGLGSAGSYTYLATTNASGIAYVWVPLGSQTFEAESGVEAGSATETITADNNNTVTITLQPPRYLVYKDTDMTTLLSSHYWMKDAVGACGTDGAYTIIATEDDADVTNSTATYVTIPSNKIITLTSSSGGPYTITQPNLARHLYVQGSLTLNNVILSGGATPNPTSGGGGVQVTAGSIFTMNAGAVIQNCYTANVGGAVRNTNSTFTMNVGSSITGNTAASGGGASLDGGTFTMNGGSISGNMVTTNSGGGVFNSAAGGIFTMNGGSISGNTSIVGGGAGVFNLNIFNMTAGTISGNIAAATGGYGGGVMNGNANIPPTATFTMSGGTIDGNIAEYGGGVFNTDTFDMSGGTISGNTAIQNGGGVQVNAGSVFTMSGGTIGGNTVAAANTAGGNGGGVYVGAGGTFEMYTGAKVSGNRAVYGGGVYSNGIFDMTAGTISTNTASQNGGGVLITSNGTFTMSGGIIGGTAAGDANAAGGDGGGIMNNTGGLFTMSGGEISGNTASGSSGGGGVANGGTFNMSGGKISGNTADQHGGGVYNMSGGAFTMSASAQISTNTATQMGGGLGNLGTVIIDGGKISGNTADQYGGGVWSMLGTVTMNDGEISSNTALHGGGVISYNGATFTMNDGEIRGNEATAGNGGGVNNNSNGTFNMLGGKISGNTAATNGGGVWNSGTVTMGGAEISSNTATAGDGGGIWTNNTTTYANLNIASTVVFSSNTASRDALPPANALTVYPTILSTSSSIYTHPLNNYDINRAYVIVTVHYVDTSNTAIGSPTSNTYTVPGGNSFELTSAQIPTISGHVLVDWKEGSSGAPKGNTTVSLPNVAAATDIYLVYQSYYTITEKYVDASGNPIVISGTPVADTSQNIMPGAAYNGSAVSIPGYVCIGHKIGSSSDTFATAVAGTSGDTSPTVSNVGAEQTVWFIYAQEIGSIKIEKYAHDGTTLLPGAEFQLEKLTGPGGTIDTTFTAQTLTTGAGGNVTFANLSAGSYRITETKAPAGYELLTAAFEADIPKDITYAVGTTPADTSYLYSTTSGGNVTYHYYDVTYKVSDQASIAMPAAGAAGTFPPYALWGGGIILLAALGGGILWLKRRRAYSPRHG